MLDWIYPSIVSVVSFIKYFFDKKLSQNKMHTDLRFKRHEVHLVYLVHFIMLLQLRKPLWRLIFLAFPRYRLMKYLSLSKRSHLKFTSKRNTCLSMSQYFCDLSLTSSIGKQGLGMSGMFKVYIHPCNNMTRKNFGI